MLRSLRKGKSSVYFQHENTGHSIGAEKFESAVDDGAAVLRFILKPVDENQRQDESYLHEEDLVSITIDDERIVDGFVSHVKASGSKISNCKIEVLSRNKMLVFEVQPQFVDHGAVKYLEFQVASQYC
ncbi:hypothetical protein [Halomonas sp. Y3]|uniref:hypothetical protein n=1 Tax=Halomonas sp. Y3 TaxID=2956797 RepID=UPI00209D9BFD|nr:hypothetical protein [Halomonas sp. Y3]